jgi:hypothetical protein
VTQFPNLPEVFVIELDPEPDAALAQEVQELDPRKPQQLRSLSRGQFIFAVETQYDLSSAEFS